MPIEMPVQPTSPFRAVRDDGPRWSKDEIMFVDANGRGIVTLTGESSVSMDPMPHHAVDAIVRALNDAFPDASGRLATMTLQATLVTCTSDSEGFGRWDAMLLATDEEAAQAVAGHAAASDKYAGRGEYSHTTAAVSQRFARRDVAAATRLSHYARLTRAPNETDQATAPVEVSIRDGQPTLEVTGIKEYGMRFAPMGAPDVALASATVATALRHHLPDAWNRTPVLEVGLWFVENLDDDRAGGPATPPSLVATHGEAVSLQQARLAAKSAEQKGPWLEFSMDVRTHEGLLVPNNDAPVYVTPAILEIAAPALAAMARGSDADATAEAVPA